MAAEFVDYKKNPAYWFVLQLTIAENLAAHPEDSSKNKDLGINEIDFLTPFDYGLKMYQRYDAMLRSLKL